MPFKVTSFRCHQDYPQRLQDYQDYRGRQVASWYTAEHLTTDAVRFHEQVQAGRPAVAEAGFAWVGGFYDSARESCPSPISKSI